jgi:transcriptional regulator with XRE-family HTH domain
MNPGPRYCADCGAPQNETRATVPYPESGLDNVELRNVPVWVCGNGHQEVEIPAVQDLHNLLAHLIVRQPAPLSGRDIRFLRKRVGLTARQFAAQIGRTPEWISQVENSRAVLDRTNDLLFRLSLGVLVAAKSGRSADDLAPLVEELEQAMGIGAHRVRHNENALPNHEWEAEDAAP